MRWIRGKVNKMFKELIKEVMSLFLAAIYLWSIIVIFELFKRYSNVNRLVDIILFLISTIVLYPFIKMVMKECGFPDWPNNYRRKQ